MTDDGARQTRQARRAAERAATAAMRPIPPLCPPGTHMLPKVEPGGIVPWRIVCIRCRRTFDAALEESAEERARFAVWIRAATADLAPEDFLP